MIEAKINVFEEQTLSDLYRNIGGTPDVLDELNNRVWDGGLEALYYNMLSEEGKREMDKKLDLKTLEQANRVILEEELSLLLEEITEAGKLTEEIQEKIFDILNCLDY